MQATKESELLLREKYTRI